MNLLCGVLGVIASFSGRLDCAFPLMLAAAVFDFFDGFAARALKASSGIGKELDSLADTVSFGVLPAIMLYRQMTELSGESVWCFIPLSISVFTALRLARFNVDDRQTVNFIGLPSPANAIMCGALVDYVCRTPDSFLASWASGTVFYPVLSIVSSLLLVCGLPMFSLKFKKGEPVSKLRVAFLVLCAAVAAAVLATGQCYSLAFLAAIPLYILANVIAASVGTRQRHGS